MAKIPDLPENERPRERLARLGASALSDAELLAIFFRTGVTGSSAIEVGRKLLRKYGSLSELGGLSVKELSEEHGIGPAKAAQMIAAFELGSRCADEKMSRVPMDSPAAIYQAMAPRLAHEKKEHVIIILLDSKLRSTRTIHLSAGSANTTECNVRDVLHHVLINRASAFALVHNHPSGDPAPSHRDTVMTRQIRDASHLMEIRFVDHVIVGRPSDSYPGSYYSFTEDNAM